MSAFRFEIVSPDMHETFEDVSLVDVPAADGRLSVLAGHQPSVCLLDEGVVRVRQADGESRYNVRHGVLSVGRDIVSLVCRNVRRQGPEGDGV